MNEESEPRTKRRPRVAPRDPETLYRDVLSGELSLQEAIRAMQHLSGLTQVQFAQHRGISVQALRKILSGDGNPTVETLNRIVGVFGLQVGFVPKRRQQRQAARPPTTPGPRSPATGRPEKETKT